MVKAYFGNNTILSSNYFLSIRENYPRCSLDLMHRWKVGVCVVHRSLKAFHVPTLLWTPVAPHLAPKLTRTEAALPGRPTCALWIGCGRGDLRAAGQTRRAAGQVQAWDMQWWWGSTTAQLPRVLLMNEVPTTVSDAQLRRAHNLKLQSTDAYLTSNLDATRKHYSVVAHKLYSKVILRSSSVSSSFSVL